MQNQTITRNHTNHRCGACHQKAKLTSAQVAEMRAEHAQGGCSYQYLAQKFKCGISTARDIVLYRTRWNG
jgi:hypothetical protein